MSVIQHYSDRCRHLQSLYLLHQRCHLHHRFVKQLCWSFIISANNFTFLKVRKPDYIYIYTWLSYLSYLIIIRTSVLWRYIYLLSLSATRLGFLVIGTKIHYNALFDFFTVIVEINACSHPHIYFKKSSFILAMLKKNQKYSLLRQW